MYRLKEPLIHIPSVMGDFRFPIQSGAIHWDTRMNTEEKENALKNKWKDAVEKAVKKDAPLRLEVGKKHLDRLGEIVKIIEDDGMVSMPLRGSNGRWYTIDGICHGTNSPIVAPVEEEPAKAEEPKKNPPFAVGQIWRRRDGERVMVSYGPDKQGNFEVVDKKAMRLSINTDLMACALSDDYDLVEYIGEANLEPKAAKPEEPKKNPPLAVGQAWRMRNGGKARIILHEKNFIAKAMNGIDCWPVDAQGRHIGDPPFLPNYDLVEYIGEANLDPKAEDVVQSKEIPLSEEATMSSKPQDRHESPQQDERFTQYLIEECDRLRAALDEKDSRIDELFRRLMETTQEGASKQGNLIQGFAAMQMEHERQREVDRKILKEEATNALREMCASNFDALFEELSDIKESHNEVAGDIAAVGGMISAMQERPSCPAPVPVAPQPPQEDALDKGLRLTNRTLTAAQILWKILQFAVAASLFGGAATCAVMFLK
jgi:hypothetical protein